MIAFISLCYASFYFLVFGKGWIKKTARNVSIFVGVGVVLIGTIVFIWLTVAPTTPDGRVFQYVVPITTNVSGEVVEVLAEPGKTLQKGDPLFRIDPLPFEAEVGRLEASIEQTDAQRRLAEVNVERARKLVGVSAAAQADLDRWQAELDGAVAGIRSLRAQLRNARWELDQTTIRAPGQGHLVNLQVRPGTAVRTFAGTPSATFIEHGSKQIVSSYSQSSVRRIKPGDPAEMVFSLYPGEVFSGTVQRVVRATGTAQMQAGGSIPTLSGTPSSGRYAVLIDIDGEEAAARLPQGAACSVAVYTDVGKAFHVISKVVMRINAWMAYLTSPA